MNEFERFAMLLHLKGLLAQQGGQYPTMNRLVQEELAQMEADAKGEPTLVVAEEESDEPASGGGIGRRL